MDVFKKPAVIIIIFAAIFVAIIWSYVSKTISTKKAAQQSSEQASVSLTDLTNIDAAEFDELVKSEFTAARAKAEATDPANKLSALEITLPSFELKAGEIRYIFTSESDKSNNWTISYSRLTGNFLRADIPKEDYMGSLLPVNSTLWKFNYVTALQIAEKNGGKAWRDINGLGHASIVLKQISNNSLQWIVTYYSGDTSKTVNIDAATGKVSETND